MGKPIPYKLRAVGDAGPYKKVQSKKKPKWASFLIQFCFHQFSSVR